MELYNKIDKLRKEKELTINKMSDIAGISHSTLNLWKICGTMPKIEVLEGLCYALGTTVAALLSDIDADKLTAEEIELLQIWNTLDKGQKQAFMQMIKSVKGNDITT